MNTGASYEEATAHARTTIKSQWKVSDIGGKPKLRRYSPESHYHIHGFSDNWIKNQLLDQVSSKFAGKTPEEINSQIELAVDPTSVSTGRPSYLVSRPVNEFGLKEIILDENNQPLRFIPDFSKTEEYKKSHLAREALSVSSEVYAEKLYQKQKGNVELNLDNARNVSLIGGEAFR